MKYIRTKYSIESNESTSLTSECLVEGDHRQTNKRILEQTARALLDSEIREESDEPLKFTEKNTDRTLEFLEWELLSEDEAKTLKNDLLTLVVNENVTEKACRVNYG